MPYVVVSLALALWNGRKREAAGWALGIALFGAFMAVHAHVVASRLTEIDQPMVGSWVCFGGARFVFATARMNIFLMMLPAWCTAIVVPLAVFGLLHSHNDTARRAGMTLVLYLAAFSVVGASFNSYWGFIIAPLLALGIAYAPSAISRTGVTARLWDVSQAERSTRGALPAGARLDAPDDF